MAENKKSVLLYCDLIYTIEKMDNETAGQFFKHYLRYINDKNPETDNLLVELTFESVKQNLKRDLKKWENTKDSKSLSGQEGNLKRWHPDIYKDYKKGKHTLKESLIIAKGRTPIKNIANIAVNDTVTVNVTDTVIKEVDSTTVETVGFDFPKLCDFINKSFNRNFVTINKTLQNKYKARLKEGYSKKDVTNAIINCKNEQHHKDSNYKYCTPEFFSRSITLDLHSAVKEVKTINPQFG